MIKDATGPPGSRSGPAVVDIACTNQAGGQVVLDGALPGPEPLPAAIRTLDVSSCNIVESATGAAPGSRHQLAATVEVDGVIVGGDYQTVEVNPGRATTVRLRNTYVPVPPIPPGPPEPAPSSGRRLPATGAPALPTLAIAAVAALAIGATLRKAAATLRVAGPADRGAD